MGFIGKVFDAGELFSGSSNMQENFEDNVRFVTTYSYQDIPHTIGDFYVDSVRIFGTRNLIGNLQINYSFKLVSGREEVVYIQNTNLEKTLEEVDAETEINNWIYIFNNDIRTMDRNKALKVLIDKVVPWVKWSLDLYYDKKNVGR